MTYSRFQEKFLSVFFVKSRVNSMNSSKMMGTFITCNRLDLETLEFRPDMPKILPRHCSSDPIKLYNVPSYITFTLFHLLSKTYKFLYKNIRRQDNSTKKTHASILYVPPST